MGTLTNHLRAKCLLSCSVTRVRYNENFISMSQIISALDGPHMLIILKETSHPVKLFLSITHSPRLWYQVCCDWEGLPSYERKKCSETKQGNIKVLLKGKLRFNFDTQREFFYSRVFPVKSLTVAQSATRWAYKQNQHVGFYHFTLVFTTRFAYSWVPNSEKQKLRFRIIFKPF